MTDQAEQFVRAYIGRVEELASKVPDDATPQNMAYRLGEISGITKSAVSVLEQIG